MSRRQARNEEGQAKAEALKTFLPQMFSSPKVISEGAPDVGENDRWMMSNLPAECVLSLQGLDAIATQDNLPWLSAFVETTLSALKGVNGYANDIGRDIAVAGFGGGRGKSLVKRKSWLKRNVTQRGDSEFEEVATDDE